MTPVRLLINAYYEMLYDCLAQQEGACIRRIDRLLPAEIVARPYPELLAGPDAAQADPDKLAAYRDATVAFLHERIETYNPVGIQYAFGPARTSAEEAFRLESWLDWYDSRAEFESLSRAARQRAETGASAAQLRQSAAALVADFGGYPDATIIAAYRDEPTLNHLPDYIVALAIEATLRETFR